MINPKKWCTSAQRYGWFTYARKCIVYARGLAVIAVITAACLAGSVRAAMAASTYGPPRPVTGVAPPGGYSNVITSQTITPAGGTIGPLMVDGAIVTLVIPPGAFPVSVQITITAPDLNAIGNAGLDDYKAVAGVGIEIQVNGQHYPGKFLKPLILTIRTSSITASSVVVVWNGTAFVTETDTTIMSGVAVVRFDTDSDFAVLSPTKTTPRTPIPGATRPVTGKPFLGEGILAGALLMLGAGGIVVGCRRRARVGRPR